MTSLQARVRRWPAALPGIVLAALLFGAGPGAADRPSLGRIEAVMCETADLDGRTYRPFFCASQCTCDIAGTTAQWTVGDCTETTPGEYTANVQMSPTAPGTCQGGLFDPNSGIEVGICVDTPGQSCSGYFDSLEPPFIVISDCPTGQGGLPQICTQETCTGTFMGACIAWDGTCFDGCDPNGTNTCPDVSQPPVFDSIQLSSIGAPDTTPPASCKIPGSSPVDLNSKDALACVSEIEAALGQACTPAP